MPAVGLRWSGRDAAALDPAPDSGNLAPAGEEDMNQLVSNGSQPDLAPETVSEAGPDDLQELGMLRHETRNCAVSALSWSKPCSKPVSSTTSKA